MSSTMLKKNLKLSGIKQLFIIMLVLFALVFSGCKKYDNDFNGVSELIGDNYITLVDEGSTETYVKKASLRKVDDEIVYLLTYSDQTMTIIFEVKYEEDSKASYEYTVMQNQVIIKNTGKLNLEKYKSGSAIYNMGYIEEDENNTASVTAVGNYLTSHIRYINDYLKDNDLNIKALGYSNYEE